MPDPLFKFLRYLKHSPGPGPQQHIPHPGRMARALNTEGNHPGNKHMCKMCKLKHYPSRKINIFLATLIYTFCTGPLCVHDPQRLELIHKAAEMCAKI